MYGTSKRFTMNLRRKRQRFARGSEPAQKYPGVSLQLTDVFFITLQSSTSASRVSSVVFDV